MSKPRILIIDKITQHVENISAILKTIAGYEVDCAVKYKEGMAFFNEHEYDYIIIDHSCKDSDALMESMLGMKNRQKFILLSESLNCPINCDDCLNTFQFIRLLKPIKITEVFKYIQNKVDFICPNKHRFENINTLEKLNDLINIKEYSFYNKKELVDNCLYFKAAVNKNLDLGELYRIENLINKDFFELNVLDDYCIEVKSK